MKNKIIFTFIWLLTAFGVMGQDNATFSVDEAVAYAYEHNAQIKNAYYETGKASQEVRKQLATGLPQISAQVQYQNFIALPVSLIPAEFFGGKPGEFAEVQFGTSNNLNATINASQMIFNGNYFVGLKAAEMYKELSQKQYEASKFDVRASVVKAYYSVVIMQENIKILKKNLATMEKLYSETKAMYTEGFIEEIEVDRLTLSLNSLRQELESLERQKKLSEGILKFQMGYPYEEKIELSDSLSTLLPSELSILNESKEFKSTLQNDILEQNIELTGMNIKNLKAAYLPKANVFFSASENAQRNEFNFLDFNQPWYENVVWGVNLSVPIWDSFQKRAGIQKEKINQQQQINNWNQAAQAYRMKTEQKRTALMNAWSKLENSRENQKLANKIFEVAVKKYEEGVGSSLELDNARSAYFRSSSNYINAMYDFLVAKVEYEKLLEIK